MAHRTRRAVGGTRVEWWKRLIALAILFPASAVLAPLAGLSGAAYFVLAFVMGGVFGRETGPNNMVMGWLRGIPRWYLRLIKYALLGDDFPGFVPSRA